MTLNDTELNKMQRELAILMTNSVELQNKMYDIFMNPNPGEVELRVWTKDGFTTITIDNLAKSRIPVIVNDGSPQNYEGQVSCGTIYINDVDYSSYINLGSVIEGDSPNWVRIATDEDIKIHNESEDAHHGVLASIYGDENAPFSVSDVDMTSDRYLAVNVGSLNVILGNIDKLKTTEKNGLVGAINQNLLTSEHEAGVIIDSNAYRSAGTYRPKVFEIKLDEGEPVLRICEGLGKFLAIKADGTLYQCENAGDIEPVRNFSDRKIAVFLKNLDRDVPSFECIPNGSFTISETRPYVMHDGDVWLDIGCRPYKMRRNVRNAENYELEEVDYIYLGTIEEV